MKASSAVSVTDAPAALDGEILLPYAPRGWAAKGYWFDHYEADRVCEFFRRYLRHTKGKQHAGKAFDLDPWQRWIVQAIFGWKRADGLRVYRVVYLEVPRKNGKTTLAAGIALYMTFCDNEPVGEVYSAANDKRQAAICFNEAKRMRANSEPLRSRSLPYKFSIVVPKSGASYEVLSSEAATKDGLNASCFIFDELHKLKGRDLHDVLHTSTGARAQPLEFNITTAGVDRHSLCYQYHEHAIKVRDGIIEDDEFLGIIFAADKDDPIDDPATWAKANPGIGISVGEDYLRKEAERAKTMPAYENTFRRLHLNQWTEQVTRWLRMTDWDECRAEFSFADLAGRTCYAGLDLAKVNDLTALSLYFPPIAADEKPKLVWFFWCPADDIAGRTRRDRVPYEVWRRDGLITATEGNATDFDFVEARIVELAGQVVIKELAYDRTFAGEIIQHLQEEGLNLVEFGQGFLSMAAPTAELERLVIGQLVEHDGNPIARWNASNVAVRQDPAGNKKPDKEKSTERIDGIVASIMAIGRAQFAGGTTGKSIYENEEAWN